MELSVEERRDYGKEFEEEVKTFLEDTLHLADVKGGPSFHIAPSGEANQIDAAGRFGDTLFVFECKASGRKQSKDLRSDILATSTKARIAFQNYKRIPEYSHCKEFRFIFITKRIQVNESNKELCKNQSMFYEEDNLLEYYTELKDKVGEFATYNFLADFNIYPSASEKLAVTALRTKLGGATVYNFYVDPKQLLKFAYVARRRVGKEDFYQRMLDTSRVKRIQKFLDEGGVFPTNIILSLKGGNRNWKSTQTLGLGKVNVGTLEIGGSYSACWIIDGQHRLYSFANAKSEAVISCVAFEGISVEEERGFFLEINREQRPIQADLLWDLEGLASPNSFRGIISNIVHTINKKKESHFFYRIYIPLYGTKEGKTVNMAAFCNGIQNASLTAANLPNSIGMSNPLMRGELWTITSRIARVINDFFDALMDSLDNEEHKTFILGNAGVPIMLYILEPIVAYERRGPSFSELRTYARAIAEFLNTNYSDSVDLKKLKAEVNSEGARRMVAHQIGMHMRKHLRFPSFWPAMEQDEFADEIIRMERRIGLLISSKLSSITSGWEKQKVPPDITQKARERMRVDGTRFDENFTLGDELKIVLRSDNWKDCFKEVFINKEGFISEDELKIAFDRLQKVRNPAAHGKFVVHSKEDLDQCEIYLKRLNRIIPDLVIDSTEI